MGRIHVAFSSGGQEEYDEEQLGLMWEQGLVHAESYYWKEGMADWRPIGEYFHSEAGVGVGEGGVRFAYVKDPRALTSFLVVMLWISLVFDAVSILSDVGQMQLLGGEFTKAEGSANDVRQGWVGLGYLIVSIITGITFLKWIYRANVNSRGFGAEGMHFTPGWCVGYYFIPFLNLVRPYQCMKEIWQVSHGPVDWKLREGVLVGWWWGLWLFSGVAGQITFNLSMGAETIEELRESTMASIVSEVIGIFLCIVAIRLVKAIAQKQEELVRDVPYLSA